MGLGVQLLTLAPGKHPPGYTPQGGTRSISPLRPHSSLPQDPSLASPATSISPRRESCQDNCLWTMREESSQPWVKCNQESQQA